MLGKQSTTQPLPQPLTWGFEARTPFLSYILPLLLVFFGVRGDRISVSGPNQREPRGEESWENQLEPAVRAYRV